MSEDGDDDTHFWLYIREHFSICVIVFQSMFTSVFSSHSFSESEAETEYIWSVEDPLTSNISASDLKSVYLPSAWTVNYDITPLLLVLYIFKYFVLLLKGDKSSDSVECGWRAKLQNKRPLSMEDVTSETLNRDPHTSGCRCTHTCARTYTHTCTHTLTDQRSPDNKAF